jgi:DNA-binding CsgD family transcriptional regulator
MLDAQIETIHMALRRHEDAITECQSLADQQGKTLTRLENLVDSLSASGPVSADRSLRRILTPAGPPVAEPVGPSPIRQLDINQFSPEERRLLSVFFQNRSREMSYADVATLLDKSAYTVKNQMNQIRQKADLFDCLIGSQSRHFFKLKDDLKVEKYLELSRPRERPVSMAGPDQSAPEHATTPTERTFLHS